MMLVSAVASFIVALNTENLLLAIIVGCLAALVLALVHGALSIRIHAEQVVSGLALTLLGVGVSSFIGQHYVGVSATVRFDAIPLPVLSNIPVLGQILFDQNILVYLAYVLIPVSWYLLYRTRAGLILMAAGDNPEAADAMGVDVAFARYAGVAIGGVLAGVAGCCMSLAYVTTWTPNVTGGRGWIAIALVIVAGWHPVRLAIAAGMFGLAYILAIQSQTLPFLGQRIPTYFVQMLPYNLAIVVLAISNRARLHRPSQMPAALGTPYRRAR
jgi:simple sugar transport system permease protein